MTTYSVKRIRKSDGEISMISGSTHNFANFTEFTNQMIRKYDAMVTADGKVDTPTYVFCEI